MTKQGIISYIGWIGHRNVGDEALYLANKLLFSEYHLVPYYEQPETDINLFGGGTLIPSCFNNNKIKKRKLNYAVGLGVQNPVFYNSTKRYDLRPAIYRKRLNNTIFYKGLTYTMNKLHNFNYPFGLGKKLLTKDDFHNFNKWNLNKISVRGYESRKTLAKWSGITAEVIGDPALILEPPEYFDKKENLVAINIGGIGPKWESNIVVIKKLSNVIKELKKRGYRVVIIPFHPEDVGASYLPRKLKDCQILNFLEPMDIPGLMRTLSRCKILIGERLHSLVLSAASYTPFISLEYRPKCYDFVNSVGFNRYNIRTDKINENLVLSLVNDLENNYSKIRSKLITKVNYFRKKIKSFAENVKRDIEETFG